MSGAGRAPGGGGPPRPRAKGTTALAVLAALAFALARGAVAGPSPTAGGQDVERWTAIERPPATNEADAALLGRPLALCLRGEALYVADGQDCAVKVFSRDGRFLRAIGRKGRGPGELDLPSGVAAGEGGIYVADKLNRRVQVFDLEGRVIGGFPVPFAPDKILVLGGGRLLVTGNPSGRVAGEPMLRIYGPDGRLLWEGLEAFSSSDRTYDAFRNMILVCPGDKGGFDVVYRSGDRDIRRFDGAGALRARVPVDGRHAFRPLDMPFAGPVKRLLGFCWAAAGDAGLLYLAAPEPVDGRDLGPGRRLSVVDGGGRLLAALDLPRPVHRFVVEGRHVFAIDDEGALALFEVVR